MITVPTHKRHKSPFKHWKTIYVFTSRAVIVNVQFHSTKKVLKGLNDHCKNDVNTGAQQIHAILLQDLMKRGVCKRAVEMLLYGIMSWFP
jgi:hypothetical protein